MNWQQHDINDRRVMLQQVAENMHLPDYAIEKDWWVTMVLKALFETDCVDFLEFKGGTSLSKGWNFIERFSEDIDLTIDHTCMQIMTRTIRRMFQLFHQILVWRLGGKITWICVRISYTVNRSTLRHCWNASKRYKLDFN